LGPTPWGVVDDLDQDCPLLLSVTVEPEILQMFPQAQLSPVPVVAEVPRLAVPAMGEDQLD